MRYRIDIAKLIKIVCLTFCLCFIFFSTEGYSAGKFEKIKKSTHFIIYYQQASTEYINQVTRKAERYYKSITSYLGFKRFNFWLWDNRCKIYFYPDRESYLRNSVRASWSRAHVDVLKKEISTYIGQDRFFDTILPHEMGHIVFREFIGYNKQLPLWIDEGVACMQERGSKERLIIAKILAKWKLHIPLSDLSRVNNYAFIIPLIFYCESASILDFLIRRYGRTRFVRFCRRLRDENNWEEALISVYKLSDLDALEKLWIADLAQDRKQE